MLKGLSFAYSYTCLFMWSPARVTVNSIVQYVAQEDLLTEKQMEGALTLWAAFSARYPKLPPQHSKLHPRVTAHILTPNPVACVKVFLTQVSGSSEGIDFWTAERSTGDWDVSSRVLLSGIFYCGCHCVLFFFYYTSFLL